MPIERRRLYAAAAVGLLILLVVGVAIWLRRGGGEPPAASGPIGPPQEVFARFLPSRSLAIAWSFDPAREAQIAGFRVRMFAGSDDLGSAFVAASERSYVDTANARPGRRIEYVVAADDLAGRRHYSSVVDVTVPDLDGAPPPVPSGVSAHWRTLHGTPVIEVRWTPGDPRRVAGYRVYADDVRGGALQPRHDPLTPLLGTVAAFEAANTADRDVEVAVVAVDARLWESEPARVVVPAMAAIASPPTAVEASRASEPGSPVALRWTYENAPDLAGFRVFDHGLEVANETVLGAAARSWTDPVVIDRWTYSFEVQAVFSDGRLSPLGRAAPLPATLSEQERRPLAPQGLVAQWARTEDGAGVVRVTWNAAFPAEDIARYELSVRPPGSDAFEPVRSPIAGEQFDYAPPARTGDIAFRLEAIDRAGRRSPPAETDVIAAVTLLMPARLIDFREGPDGQLTLVWKYPPSPVIRGFRLYRNGTIVADERRVGAEQRAWTLRVSEPGRHHFEIEAVAVDGGVSPRGTGIDYDRQR